jgi:hypothetical protein
VKIRGTVGDVGSTGSWNVASANPALRESAPPLSMSVQCGLAFCDTLSETTEAKTSCPARYQIPNSKSFQTGKYSQNPLVNKLQTLLYKRAN